MHWAIISFMCSVNGCTQLPRINFTDVATADSCRVMRNILIKPEETPGERWIEAYCSAIDGTYP